MHDIVTMVVDKAPIKVCSVRRHRLRWLVSIVKGAKNGQCEEVLRLGVDPCSTEARRRRPSPYQVPDCEQDDTIPPEAPKLEEIKLINFDFAEYGSSDDARRASIPSGTTRSRRTFRNKPYGSEAVSGNTSRLSIML